MRAHTHIHTHTHTHTHTHIQIYIYNIALPNYISPQPPSPPAPFLLHLGLTAHTHSLTDYAHTFGDLEKFYINPKTEIDTSKMLPQGGSGLVQMKADEREMILCILSQMIRYQHKPVSVQSYSCCNPIPCIVTNTYYIAMYMHTPYS